MQTAVLQALLQAAMVLVVRMVLTVLAVLMQNT
jgi:hypothetical protein